VNLRYKLLSLAGIVTVSVGLAVAPASAAGAEVVAFQGATTSLTPVQLVGGTGSYAFSTAAPVGCKVFAELNTSDLNDEEVAESCTVSAAGGYNNIVCGTGTTGGFPGTGDTATLSGEPEGTGAGFDTTINYGILFVGSVGVIVGTSSGEDAGGHVVGVVQIAPTGGNCVSGVTQFTATAVTAGVIVP